MPAESVRLPDLWLKRDLMMALLPPGADTDRASGKLIAQCMRGETATSVAFTRVMRGDTFAGLSSDLYYLAATFEYLLREGAEGLQGRSTIETFIARRPNDGATLTAKSFLGTYSDFARAALQVARRRVGWSAQQEASATALMDGALQKAIHEDMTKASDHAGELRMLHGSKRNWALSSDALQRLIRQPEQQIPTLTENDFVQIVVPPAPNDQWVFGFELATDAGAATTPWERSGSWFAPRLQRRGEALALLTEYERDEDNPRAAEPGCFRLNLVALPAPDGANEPPALPRELVKLLKNTPDWPVGYAEAMACVIYTSRLSEAHLESLNGRERDERCLEPLRNDVARAPSRARLYRADYRVLPRAAG